MDARLLSLRNGERLSFSRISGLLGKTRASALSRYYRLIGHEFPSSRRKRKPPLAPSMPTPPRLGQNTVGVSKYPYAPDCSCPDFAWDDDHCAAVLASGGYPVLARRAEA